MQKLNYQLLSPFMTHVYDKLNMVMEVEAEILCHVGVIEAFVYQENFHG